MPRLGAVRCLVRACLCAFALLIGFAADPALAQTAEELRRDGKACEQPDGYMRALSADAQAAVQRINQQRFQFYQDRAGKESVTIAAVAILYAQQIRGQQHYRAC